MHTPEGCDIHPKTTLATCRSTRKPCYRNRSSPRQLDNPNRCCYKDLELLYRLGSAGLELKGLAPTVAMSLDPPVAMSLDPVVAMA
jgi:hypothetical protein